MKIHFVCLGEIKKTTTPHTPRDPPLQYLCHTPKCLDAWVCAFELSIVRTIESVFGVCCDATLTFTGLPGKVCKQLGATVIRMHTNYDGRAAIPLFVD